MSYFIYNDYVDLVLDQGHESSLTITLTWKGYIQKLVVSSPRICGDDLFLTLDFFFLRLLVSSL